MNVEARKRRRAKLDRMYLLSLCPADVEELKSDSMIDREALLAIMCSSPIFASLVESADTICGDALFRPCGSHVKEWVESGFYVKIRDDSVGDICRRLQTSLPDYSVIHVRVLHDLLRVYLEAGNVRDLELESVVPIAWADSQGAFEARMRRLHDDAESRLAKVMLTLAPRESENVA